MINTIPTNSVRFILLILFQVLILNNANLTPLNITPFVFILFIILLPFETPNWLLLILAFLMGIVLDIFSDELGKFAFSLVLIAFSRPTVLRLLSSRDGYRKKTLPNLQDYGLKWFFKYAIIMILIHNISFYFLEAFQLKYLLVTIARIILNSSFTVILIVLLQFFAVNKRYNN
jgi:rod shape-determining protein MreD